LGKRPLGEDIRTYCEQHVKCLPNLPEVYNERLNIQESGGMWAYQIVDETKERILESMVEDCKPFGPHMAFGPDRDGQYDQEDQDAPSPVGSYMKNPKGEWAIFEHCWRYLTIVNVRTVTNSFGISESTRVQMLKYGEILILRN
jgi:hypothetical protein